MFFLLLKWIQEKITLHPLRWSHQNGISKPLVRHCNPGQLGRKGLISLLGTGGRWYYCHDHLYSAQFFSACLDNLSGAAVECRLEE